jgi:hypothetical protein
VTDVIEAEKAVLIAKQEAARMLGKTAPTLEEIELDSYKGREIWNITLGFARKTSGHPPLARISMDPIQYKRFLVDAATGKLVAIKLREPVAR